ncbi:MAG: hypothetical protein OQL20_03990 [Sedimenticola sp.]|nr:hypothetical protein [Sedimenticola sp.]
MKSVGDFVGRGEYWVLMALGLIALILSVASVILTNGNRSLEREIGGRQEFLNQSIQLSRFNVQQIKMLATVASQTRDQQLEGILSTHGITYTTK